MSTDAALDPPRAHGAPLGQGRLRAEPEDFIVEEQLGFEPAGAGQHVLLKVRKRDANTQWIARELARACGCRPLDVGYAGLKDRRAVATQWFTVPQSRSRRKIGWAWEAANTRYWRRIAIPASCRAERSPVIASSSEFAAPPSMTHSLRAASPLIEARGVPNYFGPQRFGKGGSNLKRMSEDVRALGADGARLRSFSCAEPRLQRRPGGARRAMGVGSASSREIWPTSMDARVISGSKLSMRRLLIGVRGSISTPPAPSGDAARRRAAAGCWSWSSVSRQG